MKSNWWDARSQQYQDKRILPGASKQPAWKWRGTGVHTYTHNTDAVTYVAQCRQREIEKMEAKTERALSAAKLPAVIPEKATVAASRTRKGNNDMKWSGVMYRDVYGPQLRAMQAELRGEM